MKKLLWSVLVLSLAFSISCSDSKQYNIGGRVTGLDGTLVLQNNLAYDLEVTENGPFRFNTRLVAGQPYDITIKSSTDNHECSITNGSGTITKNITTVRINCSAPAEEILAQWYDATSLSDNISPNGENAQYPRVASDSSGNAIVIWNQDDGTNYRIYMSEYRNGEWTHPSGLSDSISPAGFTAYDPQVAMDDNGNAIIVWQGADGSNTQTFKAEYRSGAWTFPADENDNISPNGFDCQNPFVAMDNNGNAIITWSQTNGTNYQIFKSEYRAAAWTHPTDENDNITPDGHDAYGPARVAMSENDEAVMAWTQYDGDPDIYMSEYRAGAWTHPADTNDFINFDGNDCDIPAVAMDDDGNTVITWRQFDGANEQVFKSEYRAATWTHPASLADNISVDGGDAGPSSVAMDNDNNIIIVWSQDTGVVQQVFISEYRAGSWTHPSDLNDNISPGGTPTDSPSVAMNDLGEAIVTWLQSDGSNVRMFRSEYREESWTHPASTTEGFSPAGQDAIEASVAINDDGEAFIVYRQSDGSNNQVFLSEYR